jgi:uncharacterized membrane protein YccC
MDGPSNSSISSAIDETVAALDYLHRPAQERRARHLDDLRAVVAGLDGGMGTDAEADEGQVRERPMRSPGSPYLPLPRRNTPGGQFGPVVREKIREQALEKASRRW